MNKVAVITGSSKGIGAATVLAFAKAGYDVVINYRSDQAAAASIAAQAEKFGGMATIIQSDVFTVDGIAHLFAELQKTHAQINVLINNAGYASEPSFEELTYESITESLTANFTSAVLCTQAAIPLIKPGGSILFCGSIYGLDYGGNPELAIYSAGKAAIKNFAQTMAEKLAPNIRCNTVAPGVTETPAWDDAGEEYIKKRQNMGLIKEWVSPDEIGAAFVFLAETPHMNAQTIVVDGGYMKKFPA